MVICFCQVKFKVKLYQPYWYTTMYVVRTADFLGFSAQQSLKELSAPVQITLGFVANKSHYADKGGAWVEISPKEIEEVIAIISHCGHVNVTSFPLKLEHKGSVPWV